MPGTKKLKPCKHFGWYKGKRPPRCNGGKGCPKCWAIFHRARERRQREEQ